VTGLCPECLCIWSTHHNNRTVQGLGFDQIGRPVSDLPRAFCPDCKRPKRKGSK
jgi:hypothetical protein